MRVRLAALSTFILISADGTPALAAGPTTAECLAASSASLAASNEHRLRAEKEALLVCAASSCPSVIRKECASRVDEVSARTPTVLFQAKDGSGAELSAVRVTMDGSLLTDHLDGTVLPLDPGSHGFTFEAEGQPPSSLSLVLHEGEKNRPVEVRFGPEVRRPPPGPGESVVSSGRAGGGQRTAGLVFGGVGVASATIGAIFGALTLSSWSSASRLCPSHNACPSSAVGDRSNAVTYSTVSDVGFVAGGVLAATGLTLYLTAARRRTDSPGLTLVPGGLRMAGAF
jgi:hypothetical protein